MTIQPMQRVHADYCGPFIGKYYALVVQDAFSKFPEVFLTTSANSQFTKEALQKFFSREGMAQVLVTDNGSHFAAKDLQKWFKSIGCQALFIAPRLPQSNGQAENFVRTPKSAIQASNPTTSQDLHGVVDTFLLQYRNAKHAATKNSPAMFL
jgi:transposase InsO family protein